MGEKIKYATFFLSGIYFGIPAISVQEVLEYQTIVPIPLAPAAMPGVINLRGQILTVLDLRERLQLPGRDPDTIRDSRMAVLRTQEGPLTILIDRVGEICDADSEWFEPPAETIRANVRSVVSHLCKLEGQLLLILDIGKLIPDEARSVQTARPDGAPEVVAN